MFSQVSVILSTGQVHMAGGVCMGGAWQGGMCGKGYVCGKGACMAGGMHGGGHAWWGACMAGGTCVAVEMATAADGTHPTGMHSCSCFNAAMQI